MPPEQTNVWHRFRFYEGRFSTFDLVERCQRPATCIGCLYHHPFCDETGRVLAGDEISAKCVS